MKHILPKVFSQNDGAYKDEKLGTSTVLTIGSDGCLLCDATMVCCYHGKDTDPSKLNREMRKVGGFVQGGLWVWGKLEELYSDIKFDWDVYNEGFFYDIPADLTMLDRLLNEGLLPIVLVDFNPGGDREDHWVVVKGKVNNSYIVQDPWPNPSEEYYFEAKYGDPARYIFAVRVYRGPKPGPPESDLELHKKVDEIAESLVKLEGTIKQNTNSLEGLSTSIDNVKRDTEELYKDREIITNIREEVVALETKVNESIKKQTTIETNLKTDIRKIYDFINKAIERVDQARGELAERVKKLEEQPVPVDNKKVKILIKLRNFIIGWIVKGGE